MTLNQLIKVFNDIADRHYQINDFSDDQDFNIDADNAPDYPILVARGTNPSLLSSDNGYKTKSITFDVQVVDLVNKDMNSENDVMSDTLQILTDVVTELSNHPDYIEDELNIIGDIDFNPLWGVYDSDVTGWKIEIDIQQPNKSSYCTNPIQAK